MKECTRHPVPGKPCTPPGPHEIARGDTGCIWCGKPIKEKVINYNGPRCKYCGAVKGMSMGTGDCGCEGEY